MAGKWMSRVAWLTERGARRLMANVRFPPKADIRATSRPHSKASSPVSISARSAISFPGASDALQPGPIWPVRRSLLAAFVARPAPHMRRGGGPRTEQPIRCRGLLQKSAAARPQIVSRAAAMYGSKKATTIWVYFRPEPPAARFFALQP
jgi:hypothetical protein